MEMRTTFYPGLDLEPDHGLNHHYPKPLPTSSLPNTLLPYLYSNFTSPSKDLLSQELMNPMIESYVPSNVSKIGRALALNSTLNGSSNGEVPGEYVESITMEEIVSVVVPIIFGLIVIVGLFGQ